MNDLRRGFGGALAALLLAAGLGFAQGDSPKQPLSEAALLKLLKSDLEEEVIVTLIEKRGVAFAANDAALGRLKEGGASNAVLAAVKAHTSREAPKTEEKARGSEDNKVLATAKHEKGLIVEVLEVKPDPDKQLLTIKWRYRNPTKRAIELVRRSGPAVTFGDPLVKSYNSIYYLEGNSNDEAAFRCSIVKDTGHKLWATPINRLEGVKVPAEGEYNFWAKFALPEATTKKISLHMEGVEPIEGIPVQK
jgi:hypothetical protein